MMATAAAIALTFGISGKTLDPIAAGRAHFDG